MGVAAASPRGRERRDGTIRTCRTRSVIAVDSVGLARPLRTRAGLAGGPHSLIYNQHEDEGEELNVRGFDPGRTACPRSSAAEGTERPIGSVPSTGTDPPTEGRPDDERRPGRDCVLPGDERERPRSQINPPPSRRRRTPYWRMSPRPTRMNLPATPSTKIACFPERATPPTTVATTGQLGEGPGRNLSEDDGTTWVHLIGFDRFQPQRVPPEATRPTIARPASQRWTPPGDAPVAVEMLPALCRRTGRRARHRLMTPGPRERGLRLWVLDERPLPATALPDRRLPPASPPDRRVQRDDLSPDPRWPPTRHLRRTNCGRRYSIPTIRVRREPSTPDRDRGHRPRPASGTAHPTRERDRPANAWSLAGSFPTFATSLAAHTTSTSFSRRPPRACQVCWAFHDRRDRPWPRP